jgi:hypothetical protein
LGFPRFGSSQGCCFGGEAAWSFDGVLVADVLDDRFVARRGQPGWCAGAFVDEVGLGVGGEQASVAEVEDGFGFVVVEAGVVEPLVCSG